MKKKKKKKKAPAFDGEAEEAPAEAADEPAAAEDADSTSMFGEKKKKKKKKAPAFGEEAAPAGEPPALCRIAPHSTRPAHDPSVTVE